MSTRRLAVNPQRNLLTNPGMEIKQRTAASFTTPQTTSTYTLDAWLLYRDTSTPTVTQIASTIGSPGQSAQVAYTHGFGGQAQYFQRVPGYERLAGQPVTLAMTVRSTVPGTVYLTTFDGVGGANSATNVGTGVERLVVGATLAAGATFLQVGIVVSNTTCTVEVNDATLVPGNVPADFVPLPLADEMARCLRLYERHGFKASGVWSGGPGGATQDLGTFVMFAAAKHAVPTMTKVGAPWLLSNCSDPRIEVPGVEGYMIRTTATANGTTYFQCNSVNQGVTAESMP